MMMVDILDILELKKHDIKYEDPYLNTFQTTLAFASMVIALFIIICLSVL